MEENTNFKDEIWRPPQKSGLSNSEPIIPSYYLKTIVNIIDGNEEKIKFLKVDYLHIIKDDIRNFRQLNKYQLSYIKNYLSQEDKDEIIELFNKAMSSLIQSI